jgi:hypothetical protein
MTTIKLPARPTRVDDIMMFKNGLLLVQSTDYLVDWINQQVTSTTIVSNDQVILQTIETGGTLLRTLLSYGGGIKNLEVFQNSFHSCSLSMELKF